MTRLLGRIRLLTNGGGCSQLRGGTAVRPPRRGCHLVHNPCEDLERLQDVVDGADEVWAVEVQ